MRYPRLFTLAVMIGLSAASMKLGIEYSRHQIRSIAEDVAETDKATGTNTFSRCLVELWEQTGELDADWKGKRRWILLEPAHGGKGG